MSQSPAVNINNLQQRSSSPPATGQSGSGGSTGGGNWSTRQQYSGQTPVTYSQLSPSSASSGLWPGNTFKS